MTLSRHCRGRKKSILLLTLIISLAATATCSSKATLSPKNGSSAEGEFTAPDDKSSEHQGDSLNATGQRSRDDLKAFELRRRLVDGAGGTSLSPLAHLHRTSQNAGTTLEALLRHSDVIRYVGPFPTRWPVYYTLSTDFMGVPFSRFAVRGDVETSRQQISLSPHFEMLIVRTITDKEQRAAFVSWAIINSLPLPYYMFLDWANEVTLASVTRQISDALNQNNLTLVRLLQRLVIFDPEFLRRCEKGPKQLLGSTYGLSSDEVFRKIAAVPLTERDAGFAALYGFRKTVLEYIAKEPTFDVEGVETGIPFDLLQMRIVFKPCEEHATRIIPQLPPAKRTKCPVLQYAQYKHHGHLITSLLSLEKFETADFLWTLLSLEQKMHMFYFLLYPTPKLITDRWGGATLLFLDLFSNSKYEEEEDLMGRFLRGFHTVASVGQKSFLDYAEDLARAFGRFMDFAIGGAMEISNSRERAVRSYLRFPSLSVLETTLSIPPGVSEFLASMQKLLEELELRDSHLFEHGQVAFCPDIRMGTQQRGIGNAGVYYFIPMKAVADLLDDKVLVQTVKGWAQKHRESVRAVSIFYELFFEVDQAPCVTPLLMPGVKFSADAHFIERFALIKTFFQWIGGFNVERQRVFEATVCAKLARIREQTPLRPLLKAKYDNLYNHISCL